MKKLLVDTGIWYAMFDKRDPYYQKVEHKVNQFDKFQLMVLWPTMYETLCTRFVQNKRSLELFEKYLKKPNIHYLDDIPYRDNAFRLSFDSSLNSNKPRPLSMVDCLIRLVIDDENTKIHGLATFNERDFYDICVKNKVELI